MFEIRIDGVDNDKDDDDDDNCGDDKDDADDFVNNSYDYDDTGDLCAFLD